MQVKEKSRYAIQSIESALDVLEAICDIEGDVSIAHLSHKLAMNKGTVFRLLATFEHRGYLERSMSAGKYRVGISACEMGRKLMLRMDLWRNARPIMSQLVRDCEETVYLAVLRGQEVLLLDTVETSQRVQIISMVGKRFPLDRISAGKVIQAFRNPTCPSGEDGQIKSQGICTDRDALGEGATSMSAPFFNAQGKIAGCLCLVGPTFRFTEERIDRDLIPILKLAAQSLSSKLGFNDGVRQ